MFGYAFSKRDNCIPYAKAVLQSISGMLEHSGIRVNDFGLSPRAKIEFCIENY